VAKVLSMGLLVWMRFQCSAGKSVECQQSFPILDPHASFIVVYAR
jgi:hypothetical protein